MNISIVFCYLMILFVICVLAKAHRTHLCPVFFCPFLNERTPYHPNFDPDFPLKTDMPVSEVSCLMNGILGIARGSHLRRVFPVPRDYIRQSITVPITGCEVQPKWSNPSVCSHTCGLVLHVWSSPFRQKPKEGFTYAKERQPEKTVSHLSESHP